MHDIETLKRGGYRDAGLTELRLACPLSTFPEEILQLGATLKQLDLSGTGLSSLPANLGVALPNLKIALFSACNFRVFPRELASCPNLETVAFPHNGMEEIPEDAFPPRLRWLILTGNRLTSLPSSIGRCQNLQRCMLAGNQLRALPAEMARCKRLALLRISANRIEALPAWLFTLPELAFLSFASNPCAAPPPVNGVVTAPGLADIAWSDLEVKRTLGADASGTTFEALWHQSPHYAEEVAIKLFRGSLTNDGRPADEMAVWLAAGAHESLITVLGRIHGHPDEDDTTTSADTREEAAAAAGPFQGGIVLQQVPAGYAALGEPPSPSAEISSTDRTSERFPPRPPPPPPPPPAAAAAPRGPSGLSIACALSMLTGLAGALAHLHARGLAHGDVSAHNVLASRADAHALLAGFAAATVDYRRARVRGNIDDDDGAGAGARCEMERIEVLAFAHLLEYVLGLAAADAAGGGGGGGGGGGAGAEGREEEVRKGLWELHARCAVAEVAARPLFEEVVEVLEGMMGWRGMMRIPP
ncbi:uncharacterized protein THITE_2111033 [Thermothielavioides terrestris NRRL 8126]|uniref:Protein kinase domain-containing protein n=1 Tax=Thermothielavioides terrestris (strain ATCC 38088 / NRRL 8126) TaxID=578455 RepID=G2QWG4_THETT|nr:uncharacterized protein THITE_2111033 [Thermothielavioides terrestris NRRL 8126]AEO64739.1 hypothetical protein THITE_2111033 [Thermothielavioides terrestris NRRL 8126]